MAGKKVQLDRCFSPRIVAVLIGAGTFLLQAKGHAAVPPSDAPDFVRDVQPILAANCYDCHGPKKQKGELRLDVKSIALRGGHKGKAIVVGKPNESLLLKRVLSSDTHERMPLDHDPLKPEQIAVLKKWVDSGAEWPDSASAKVVDPRDHWAFKKPARPEVPAVKDSKWIRNPIDNFVLAGLERENLKPSSEAPREILIRRLSLDLIGLPPTVKEVDDFVADKTPDAYERLTARLLASPHYGEKWARPWLDMARYADSNGYEKDNRRTIWPFRDWVIKALNDDMSFKEFTIEQIAGDMLPKATQEQRVATGFHRNTMLNEEGGVDPAEARWLTLVDRVNTTGAVWLGSTVMCAQCHNHKFDPISQKEYYQLLAFFENADEPAINVATPASDQKRKGIEEQIAKAEMQLQVTSPQIETELAQWEKQQSGAVEWTVLEPLTMVAANGTKLAKQADNSILASGVTPANDTYTITARASLANMTGFKLEVLDDASLPSNGPGASDNGNFVLSEFGVVASPGEKGAGLILRFNKSAADYSQDGYSIAGGVDGNRGTGWAVGGAVGKPHTAVFETVAPFSYGNSTTLTIKLEHASAFAKHNLGRFRISVTSAKGPAGTLGLPAGVQTTLAIAVDKRTQAQKTELLEYFRTVAPSSKPARDRIAQLKVQLNQSQQGSASTLVMQERPSDKPPTTDVRIRGSFLNKGDAVSAGVPEILSPLPKEVISNRLALANWLVDDANPLTARVQVNRMWEAYFGIGIVETAEDFGTQGTPPSHPELLDWLATEFMSNGWNMKSMHRLIVTSATYRQSSAVRPELKKTDPYNRLLARGGRFRVEAESVRDIHLALSGLLSEKMHGPSVFPPQPDGIWNLPYNGDTWTTSQGEDRYRRGIYTFKRRSAPYPAFMSFDAPSGEFCTIRRIRTNTPLQALITLNDPASFELARGMAQRLVKESPAADPSARITYGFRLCTAHTPAADQLAELVSLYNDQLQLFKADGAAAAKVIKGQPAPPAGADPADLAAWTMVCNVLMNMDETITKG